MENSNWVVGGFGMILWLLAMIFAPWKHYLDNEELTFWQKSSNSFRKAWGALVALLWLVAIWPLHGSGGWGIAVWSLLFLCGLDIILDIVFTAFQVPYIESGLLAVLVVVIGGGWLYGIASSEFIAVLIATGSFMLMSLFRSHRFRRWMDRKKHRSR